MPDRPQRLVNKGGAMVPPDPPAPTPAPPREQAPRHRGFDMGNTLMQGPPGNPVEDFLKMAATLGIAAPMSVVESLMDQYKPQYAQKDINLPNESGHIDPRIAGEPDVTRPKKRGH